MKFACVVSFALFFVWLIVGRRALRRARRARRLRARSTACRSSTATAGRQPPITPGMVFGGAAIIGVVNVVLFTALTTSARSIYNLCADLVGGIEVTLAER